MPYSDTFFSSGYFLVKLKANTVATASDMRKIKWIIKDILCRVQQEVVKEQKAGCDQMIISKSM